MTEPRTEAGRRLVDWFVKAARLTRDGKHGQALKQHILTIEIEAADIFERETRAPAPAPAGLLREADARHIDWEVVHAAARGLVAAMNDDESRPDDDPDVLEWAGRLRAALAAAEPGRQSPCDDEQLATAFAKGVVAAHESLAADEPGLDVERLARAFAATFPRGAADPHETARLVAAEYARLREDVP